MVKRKNKKSHLFFIKSFLAFCLLSMLLMAPCTAQESNNSLKEDEKENSNALKIKPEENIKVNKEFDEDGNLIRYDSIYTSYYSNIKGNPKMRDSIFQNFRKHLKEKKMIGNSMFEDFFFKDSLLNFDFYKDDFFEKRFHMNFNGMESMFKRMDSVKNHFFNGQFQSI